MNKEELLNKIRLQKGIHSYFEMRTKIFAKMLKIVLILFPAVITFLAIANESMIKFIFGQVDKDFVLIAITLISFILFILAVFAEVFGIDVKYKLHRNIINQLIKLRDELNHRIEQNPDQAIEITRELRNIYLEIIQSGIQLSDNEFFRAKKYYYKRCVKKQKLEDKYNRTIK
jgi:hypothetical protein